jgi:hypothetical protein
MYFLRFKQIVCIDQCIAIQESCPPVDNAQKLGAATNEPGSLRGEDPYSGWGRTAAAPPRACPRWPPAPRFHSPRRRPSRAPAAKIRDRC